MIRFAWPKVWLALLLLAASLSSSPFGSMEQGGGAASVGRALDYHALPIARPVDLSSTGDSDLTLRHEIPSPSGAALAAGGPFLATSLLHRIPELAPPRERFPGPRISERLPYHPNAPPRTT
jgi:hypothetical protein